MMPEQIRTAAEAVRVLEARGHYLAVQFKIEPPRWKLFTRDLRIQVDVSAEELVEFARLSSRPPQTSVSLAELQQAVARILAADFEAIETIGGWILRGIGNGNEDEELTCDTDADLVSFASLHPARQTSDVSNQEVKSGRCQTETGRFVHASSMTQIYAQKLKGGINNMNEEQNSSERATMCATKAGNGFKVVVNGVWFYASKRQVMELIQGRQKACTFHTIQDDVIIVR